MTIMAPSVPGKYRVCNISTWCVLLGLYTKLICLYQVSYLSLIANDLWRIGFNPSIFHARFNPSLLRVTNCVPHFNLIFDDHVLSHMTLCTL